MQEQREEGFNDKFLQYSLLMNLPTFQRIQKRAQLPFEASNLKTIEIEFKQLVCEVARLRKENVRLSSQMRAIERRREYRG